MEFSRALSITVLNRSSSVTAPSDEALIRQIAKGDGGALQVLFARHKVRVYRFLLRMVHSEAAAEDLLNEVFIDIWRGANRFQARSQVTTWILSIARFKAISLMRGRRFDALDDEIVDSVEDPSDDPETVLQNSERSAILRACLEQLSSMDREVIDLVYYHEQSMEEVAMILGIPQNTVKTRVFYARKRLAKLLAKRRYDRTSL